jgi:hypothetical protein
MILFALLLIIFHYGHSMVFFSKFLKYFFKLYFARNLRGRKQGRAAIQRKAHYNALEFVNRRASAHGINLNII